MSAAGLLGILWWAGPPLIGALLGCLAALALVRVITRPSSLEMVSRRALRGLVSSPAFLRAVREAISGWVSSFSARTVKDVMDDFGVSRFISDKLLTGLAREEQRAAIGKSVESGWSGSGTPDATAFEALVPGIEALCASFLPAAVDRLVEGLRTEQTRGMLAARGRELLPKILERLNLLQRFLLSAGQFDRRLDEKMPEIIDETIVAIEQVVRDPQQQKLFLEKLVQGARDWRSSPRLRGQAGPAIAGLVAQALARLEDPSVRTRAARLIEGILGDESQTIGSALRLRFGVRDSEVSDSLANAVLTWFSRPETEEMLSRRIAETACAFLSERAPGGRLLMRWAGLAGAGLGLLIGIVETFLGLLKP